MISVLNKNESSIDFDLQNIIASFVFELEDEVNPDPEYSGGITY